MNEMRKLMEAIKEANQGGKTEHSGAKKGKGAYYGRKKDAKQDSNKNRRKADKASSTVEETVEIIGEAASSDQWEIAINNLIANGDEKFEGGIGMEENVWNWVRNELHGMLDFQPEGDIGNDTLGEDGRPSWWQTVEDLDIEELIDDIVHSIKGQPEEEHREAAWAAISKIADEFGIDVRA